MPRLRVVASRAVAVIFVLAVLATPAEAAHRCGRIYVPTDHANAKVRVVKGPETCEPARRLIRDAFTAFATRQPDGVGQEYGLEWNVDAWRCFHGLGGTEASCFRRSKRIDGSVRTDDGWSF
jgi:hypothetical protein